MVAKPAKTATITAHVTLKIADQTLPGDYTVPKGPMRLNDLLPTAHALTDRIVSLAVLAEREKGRSVSCKAGCGACCRQLVPIAPAEARRIRRLLQNMSEPRRSIIQARFSEARRKLQEASLLDALLRPRNNDRSALIEFGLAYFRQGIACPFLEEESCSIYQDRPASCREYLVTTPAAACASPSAETVDCVPIPAKVSNALNRFEGDPSRRLTSWIPLIVAPEWAEAHPQEPPRQPGPLLLQQFFEFLLDKSLDVPEPPSGGAGQA